LAPWASIPHALDQIDDASETKVYAVLVASGTYTGTGHMESWVHLYGGFESSAWSRNTALYKTILGGNQTLYFASGTIDAVLNGFTKTGASGAGGICFRSVSSATVEDCTITGCWNLTVGGIYCKEASPTLKACVISENTGWGGGGIACVDSSPRVIDCIISNNLAEMDRVGGAGGGVYCHNASPTLTNCTIAGNISTGLGGGLYCFDSSPTLIDCWILDNGAVLGAAVCCEVPSSPQFTNCVIAGNSADDTGGAMYCYDAYGSRSSPKLTNCTIVENVAWGSVGGLYCGSGYSPVLANCILWNYGSEIVGGSPSATYCCIQGGFAGEGNIDRPPLFADLDNDDYHLRDGSPCIDAGSVSEAPSGDIQGNPRPGGDGLVDMGAYETPDDYQTAPPSPPPERYYVSASAPSGGDGLSWESAFREISTGIFAGVPGGSEIWVASGTYREGLVLEPGTQVYGGFLGTETSFEERTAATARTIIDASGTGRSALTAAEEILLDGLTIAGSTSGGGIDFDYISSAVVTDCTISGNETCGVRCEDSSPTLTNCTITSNKSRGVFCSYSSPILVNCLIAANDGIGVYCYRSSPTMRNCTLAANNSLSGYGGVFCYDESSPTLVNCVLWNAGSEIEGASAVVTYSSVQGGWSGEGNVDDSPMFVDPVNGDYSLQADSPCIDSGSPEYGINASPWLLAYGDMNGRVRVWDGDGDGQAVVDMGAFEYGSSSFVADLNADEKVDPLDLFAAQHLWNAAVDPSSVSGDQNGDNRFDAEDLIVVLQAWGNR
jgi:parallel beta-helix repeat protein